MDFGTDLLLADDDIIFTGEGDIELVSGAACVAQDIDQTLKTTPGALYWDKEAGSSLLLMLNDAGSGDAAVIAELERTALADARVEPDSVKAYRVSGGGFRLEFTPVGAVKPEVLKYDLNKKGAA